MGNIVLTNAATFKPWMNANMSNICLIITGTRNHNGTMMSRTIRTQTARAEVFFSPKKR